MIMDCHAPRWGARNDRGKEGIHKKRVIVICHRDIEAAYFSFCKGRLGGDALGLGDGFDARVARQ